MAGGIIIRYTAGKARVSCRVRPRSVKGFRLWGNPWRGLMVLPGLVLVCYGYTLPGLAITALALPWSVLALVREQWGDIISAKRAETLTKTGMYLDAYNLYLDNPQEAPWLWLAGKAMEGGAWELALKALDQWPGAQEQIQRYQALCQLELGFPAKALQTLPSQQGRDVWLIRAQCYYRQQDWKKLLALGKRGLKDEEDKNEHSWLRVQGYLHTGELRSARHLLRQLVEKSGNYGLAAEMLKELLEKEGRK